MSFSHFYEHAFEFLNFLFLCACVIYLYRTYASKLLQQAIQQEKDAMYNLKQSVVTTRQAIDHMEQEIHKQDAYAQKLLAHIMLWSKKQKQKQEKSAQECGQLQEKFLTYVALQEKAIALKELKRDTSAHALSQARALLTEQYQDQHKQEQALEKMYQHCVKDLSRG